MIILPSCCNTPNRKLNGSTKERQKPRAEGSTCSREVQVIEASNALIVQGGGYGGWRESSGTKAEPSLGKLR